MDIPFESGVVFELRGIFVLFWGVDVVHRIDFPLDVQKYQYFRFRGVALDLRHWKARTPPPKTAVAHFLRACGVAQRSDFARRREETVNAHDSQHCGRWENI